VVLVFIVSLLFLPALDALAVRVKYVLLQGAWKSLVEKGACRLKGW
jgi:hypothetical protein